jgi:hypothetical protein
MKEHNVNRVNNFIMGWYADDTTFCDELIDYYHKPETIKTAGIVGSATGDGNINTDIKDSIDASFRPEMINDFKYSKVLKSCADLYYNKYPYSAGVGYGINQGFNVQRYLPKGGYKQWHCERNSADYPDVTRHLVWMTFLNDVTEGGGTQFFHQGITIKAEKGLTLIWPADWTFTHRGEVSNTQEKYIITGWYNLFTDKMKMKEENENSNLLGRSS